MAYGKDEGLSDSPFRAVFQDRDGHVWLGGDEDSTGRMDTSFIVIPGVTRDWHDRPNERWRHVVWRNRRCVSLALGRVDPVQD